jgi:hypothetical protein
MDRDQISKLISETHSGFLKNAGSAIQKVSADHHLLLNIISSKIRLIAEAMVDNEVIDIYNVNGKRGSHVFTLIKHDLDAEVDVYTNGTYITFRSGTEHSSHKRTKRIIYPDIAKNGYDWDNVTVLLLNFIHNEMYRSSEVFEVNFELMLEKERLK